VVLVQNTLKATNMQQTSDMSEFVDDEYPRDDNGPLGEEADGRNKEWEDRARVNLEHTPAGVHTNIERDFEPEEESEDKNEKKTPPAY
jgi:hypothetical protein